MAERFFQKYYKYSVIGDEILDPVTLITERGVYEIRCKNKECELSARTQGLNVECIYKQFMKNGCPACGEKEFTIRKVEI